MVHNALQIANLLLQKAKEVGESGELMTNMKLQKMLYYEQGFHLACFGTPLFEEDIEAWQYGPVVPIVYEHYRQYGGEGLEPIETSNVVLDEEEMSIFNQVFEMFNKFSAIGLMNMTHSEKPWANAGTPMRGNIISKEALKDYFLTRVE
jgi:uncharacterized phage-associated protein